MELNEKCFLLGRRIHEIRERTKKTQEDIAAAAKMTPGYFNRIENGKANPSFKRLSAIVEALGVEAKEILEFPDEGDELDLETILENYKKLSPERQKLLYKLLLVVFST